MKLLTIYSFIVWLLWSYEIWFLVYLEFARLCQCLLLSFLLVGKVDLVTIVMDMYGLLFLIVWCGVFGRKEIVGVLKTVIVLCLISSFYFLEPWFMCGETNPFLQFWIYLVYVIFEFDMFAPIYSLCTWVSVFFISINLYYLSKKSYPCIGMHSLNQPENS